jgi:Thermolysin metallopeptidase, alpha-helical domain
VHINSGIPNHAFYLAATKLGGRAWEHAGVVWYAALTDPRVGAHTDFARWAAATVAAAERRFPGRPEVARAVREAWSEVGVVPSGMSRAGGRAVSVRRSGGVAGLSLERRIDTATAEQGPRVEALIEQIPLRSLDEGEPQPDRYVFAIEVDGQTTRVREPDLTPELAELIDLVLHGDS